MNRAVATIVFALLACAERTPITLSPTLVHDGEQVSILSASPTAHTLYATPTRVSRPLRRGLQQTLGIDWEEVDTLAPDVADLGTLQELAAIAGNAYALNPGRSKNWYDLPDYWNATLPIGDSSETMMRGHVFVDTRDNATVVISIKGTTLPFTGPTSGEDRRNDNLMFSCCCARSKSVCGCFGKKWTCDTNCVEDALTEDRLFYNFGINLFNNVTYLYPQARIWIVGHSLGGALAALLGATFGAPTVAFAAPGDRLAAQRLHLPTHAPITHVVHTADPIPYGTCTICARAGFALETRCHLGKTITFDSVERLGWSQDLRHHPMRVFVDQVLHAGGMWKDVDGVEREVPLARVEEDCEDCYKWTFKDT
ncbi:alpha/beta-hydrolase [Exidia glandulosa HHB12029]|uniref:triacylglycerol lipase n=1 Tax=Exidia glandulosa HHB12029 TaxID=1314781 RepID=A0A165G7T3_EXIGL|nr:alpha/beta-hydrolase [Exidia glandulosa HHB12029]